MKTKKTIAAIIASMLVAAAADVRGAGMWWQFLCSGPNISATGNIYIFALGDDYDPLIDPLGDYSFDPNLLTLTSMADPGVTFSALSEGGGMTDVDTDWNAYDYSATVGPHGDTAYIGFDLDGVDINQWWAVAVIGEDGEWCGIDVFLVDGMDPDAGYYIRSIAWISGVWIGYDDRPYSAQDKQEYNFDFTQYKVGPIPEPLTTGLALAGAALLLAQRRRK